MSDYIYANPPWRQIDISFGERWEPVAKGREADNVMPEGEAFHSKLAVVGLVCIACLAVTVLGVARGKEKWMDGGDAHSLPPDNGAG